MKLIWILIIALLIPSILILIGHALPKRKPDKKKKSPYECGFDPIKSARLPFSFRFFLIAILFLIFDLEIALLFPLVPATRKKIRNLNIFSNIFIIILTVGLAYEWKQGGLEWAE